MAYPATESRGLYVFDAPGMRVRNLRDGAWSDLPELPDHTNLLLNWSTAGLSHDSANWTPGALFFQAEGGIVLCLYRKLPTAGFAFYHYVDGDVAWTDWTSSVSINGSAYNKTGVLVSSDRVFAYPPACLAAAAVVGVNEVGIAADEGVYFEIGQPLSGDHTIEFDFYTESTAGFQGVSLVADPLSTDVAALTVYKVAGTLDCTFGVTDSAAFSGQYAAPGAWSRVSARITLPSPAPAWLALIGQLGEGQTRIRNISLHPALDLGLYFTPALNYKGVPTWAGVSTLTGAALTFSFSAGRQLTIRHADSVVRAPRDDGQVNSHSANNIQAGRLVPHRSNLRLVSDTLSGVGQRDAVKGWAHANNYRLVINPGGSDRAVPEAQLMAADLRGFGDTPLRASSGERQVLPASTYLGGVSHRGSMFAVNLLGQVVRFDDVGGFARVMVDLPYRLPGFDRGVVYTTGPGIIDGRDFELGRIGGLPSYIPSELRGAGTLGVGFWDAYARLDIVGIPSTDAKLVALKGRRGVYTGMSAGDSLSHWATFVDGRPLFSSWLDENTGVWERQILPTGTRLRSRYSFAGSFDGFSNSETPAHVRLFDFKGSLYVLWTFGLRQVAGTDPATLPPSMIVKLAYDSESDTLSVVQHAELTSPRISFYEAVSTLDPLNGTVWLTYVHGAEAGDVTTRTVGVLSIDLATFTVRADSPSAYAVSTPAQPDYDARNVIDAAAVLVCDAGELHASVTSVAIDKTTKTAAVTFTVTSPDDRVVNVLVRAAFHPSDVPGFVVAAGLNPVTVVADGAPVTFVHDIRADFGADAVGHIQYEVLPYNVGSFPEVLNG